MVVDVGRSLRVYDSVCESPALSIWQPSPGPSASPCCTCHPPVNRRHLAPLLPARSPDGHPACLATLRLLPTITCLPSPLSVCSPDGHPACLATLRLLPTITCLPSPLSVCSPDGHPAGHRRKRRAQEPGSIPLLLLRAGQPGPPAGEPNLFRCRRRRCCRRLILPRLLMRAASTPARAGAGAWVWLGLAARTMGAPACTVAQTTAHCYRSLCRPMLHPRPGHLRPRPLPADLCLPCQPAAAAGDAHPRAAPVHRGVGGGAHLPLLCHHHKPGLSGAPGWVLHATHATHATHAMVACMGVSLAASFLWRCWLLLPALPASLSACLPACSPTPAVLRAPSESLGAHPCCATVYGALPSMCRGARGAGAEAGDGGGKLPAGLKLHVQVRWAVLRAVLQVVLRAILRGVLLQLLGVRQHREGDCLRGMAGAG